MRARVVDEALDTATADDRAAYADTSQFNRDYKFFFGITPMRDMGRLRDLPNSF